MYKEETSPQDTKLSKKAFKSAWILFGGSLIVFFIIVNALRSGEEEKILNKSDQDIHHSGVETVEDSETKGDSHQNEQIIIENLNYDDGNIVQRIREIGEMLDISETIVREAELIVHRSEEEKLAFWKLLITDPGYIAPYSAEWRIWYSFAEDSAIFPGSPARRFAMSVAQAITR